MQMQEALAEAKKNGTAWFMHRNGLGAISSFGSDKSCTKFVAVQKVQEAPEIEKIKEDIIIDKLEPMDPVLIGRIHALFREAYRLHSSEMFLHLRWNPARKRYYVSAPKCQAVSGGYLKYNAAPGRNVGTIHSHGSMGAFFSSEDDKNEKGDANTSPGIYAVMGTVMNERPSAAASIAGMGMRKDVTSVLMPAIAPYIMTEREAKHWLRTLQSSSFIHAQIAGFHLVSPHGDVLRWANTAEELVPYADKVDRIQPVTEKKEVHAIVTSMREAERKETARQWAYAHDLWDGEDYGEFDNWPVRGRKRKKTETEKLAALIEKAADLTKVVAELSEDAYAELRAAVDNARNQCRKQEEQSSFLGAEESGFTLWTP